MAHRIQVPPVRQAFSDVTTTKGLAKRYEQVVEAFSKAVYEASTGQTFIDGQFDGADGRVVPLVKSRRAAGQELRSEATRAGFAKGLSAFDVPGGSNNGWSSLMKEFTLTNPIPSGLVPYDLEEGAKLLTPVPTPLRNSLSRVKGQGSARRVKVLTGFTGTNTGGVATLQPGINESTTTAGPGGLNYVRGPYITYAGQDQTYNYVTTSLSDSVSWQAEFEGTGFQDIRSLSSYVLLYSTMLLEERLICYGRGTSNNGYSGALGTPVISVASVSASVGGTGYSLPAGNYAVVVAADAGDLLSTTGYQMHQGPCTAAASVYVASGGCIQVNITTDVQGALGYNLYAASVEGGNYVYQGRTAYNVGFVGAVSSGGGLQTVGPYVTAGAADQSAVATNYDGLITSTAASSGYVKRLNAAFSTTAPGAEFQNAFAYLYESVKGNPERCWLNGFDRMQLSNAIVNNAANSAYRVYIDNSPDGMGGVRAGTVVSSLMNEVTGSEVQLTVHPWFPQGTALIRQETLPIPNSNVSTTSYMALAQDYMQISWPPTQFTSTEMSRVAA